MRKGYPLEWSDIEKWAIQNDAIKGTTKNWDWPDFKGIEKKKIYYAKVWSINLSWMDSNKREKEYEVGDKDVINQDFGPDAIASGDGGNGGNAGNLIIYDHNHVGKAFDVQIEGGRGGESMDIASHEPTKDSTYYHIKLVVYHQDVNYWGNKEHLKLNPSVEITEKLKAQPGRAAKGKDGSRGSKGDYLKPSYESDYWLQSELLEVMLGFAKTHFRDGERNKSKWILDYYFAGIQNMPEQYKSDMRMASLVKEVELYDRRLRQNLDYYGYPPGWIPRLSALSNLKILDSSRRDLAQLIYFAKTLLEQDDANKLEIENLEWAVSELKESMDAERKSIIAAYDALPTIKDELLQIESRVADQLTSLRFLKSKILKEIKEKADAQTLFTGAFEIAAGICTLIPVGQPYVGAVGSVLSQIGKIDIDAENPLKEGLNFASGLSGELSTFITDNKGKISADATSSLTKEIKSGTKELNSFEDQIQIVKADQEAAKDAVVNKFTDQELAIIHEKVRVIENISGSENALSYSEDYVAIIQNLDSLESDIQSSKEIREDEKKRLTTHLSELKQEKKELKKRLGEQKKKKTAIEKNITSAATKLQGFTEGVSGLSSTIQNMMVEFDPDSPEVKAKFEKILSSDYKDDFEDIMNEIEELNQLKLPLVDKLLWYEQRISQGVQRINNSLIQWSVLNRQRVESIEYGLLPTSRSILKRMVEESWALLMLECYYITKSYQYRFLRRIDPLQHGLKKLFDDIIKFSKGVNPTSMDEDTFNDVFEKVLKSQFTRLGTSLLTDTQSGGGKIRMPSMTVTIRKSDHDIHGNSILQQFNKRGRASFYLHQIESGKSGTQNWKFYRIMDIEFLGIELEDVESSFDFGIRHSGESIVKDQHGVPYYFTSLSAQNNLNSAMVQSGKIDLQVHSWDGEYDPSQRNNKTGGVSTTSTSTENDKILRSFLSEFDLADKFDEGDPPYRDYYPSARSVLTLVNYEEAEPGEKPKNYGLEELKFKVTYEVLR